MRKLALFWSATLMAVGPAWSHEFWISPQVYTVPSEGQLIADIRVGEEFQGSAYTFVPSRYNRFDLVTSEGVEPVVGTVGDRPALNMAAGQNGLVTVVHETTDTHLVYNDPEKFINFVVSKGFVGVLEQHIERGLPPSGFRERYSRYAKSLIAVGDGAGQDAPVGMLTEIVALANPYTDELQGNMPVRVLYQNQPRPNVQVDVFEKLPDGSVNFTMLQTDDAGEVRVPVQAGSEYLVDAVVMRPLEPVEDKDPVWESLWASVTFMVPMAAK